MSADILDDSLLPRSYIWVRPGWVHEARELLRKESGAWATPVVVRANGRRTVVWYQPDPDEIHARIERLKREHPEVFPGLLETRRAVGEFVKKAFPQVRHVAPQLIASEITSVQPMTAPTGMVLMHIEYGNKEV